MHCPTNRSFAVVGVHVVQCSSTFCRASCVYWLVGIIYSIIIPPWVSLREERRKAKAEDDLKYFKLLVEISYLYPCGNVLFGFTLLLVGVSIP